MHAMMTIDVIVNTKHVIYLLPIKLRILQNVLSENMKNSYVKHIKVFPNTKLFIDKMRIK